jgi:hypothetical protein
VNFPLKDVLQNLDLWMSKGEHDVFALVISFLNEEWQIQHINMIV